MRFAPLLTTTEVPQVGALEADGGPYTRIIPNGFFEKSASQSRHFSTRN
ncbi:hypothetical protein [Paraburkholderia phenoliruptrix]|nr:hypothetical protein [Paraburkholderia phenoliruptrix]MBW0446004.1 hypothetical protein [Paraburkholderia phenoliruptrix]MBW9100006.1 hypothetical protein [Paraburkholderia phenoliruptrix]